MTEIVILRRITHAVGRAPANAGSGFLFGRPCLISPHPMSLQETGTVSGDFRVALDFLDHPKTVKLKSTVGAEGVFCLMRLWAFAGNYRPRGLLTGMNPQDIAIAAKWSEDANQFVSALLDSKFLDKLKNGVYRLHNWKLRQGYLYRKPERRERARKGGKARQAKVDNDLRSAKTPNKHTPSPSPSPSPKIQNSPSALTTPKEKKETVEHSDHKKFVAFWNDGYKFHFHSDYPWAGKDFKGIQRLLKMKGITLDNLKDLARAFWRMDDPFIVSAGHTVGIFETKLAALKEQKAKPKVLQPGEPGYVPM